ncbi:MAG: TonB-dependent siderophore receptor [Cyanobacteria bacterium P01_F01_bin.116]
MKRSLKRLNLFALLMLMGGHIAVLEKASAQSLSSFQASSVNRIAQTTPTQITEVQFEKTDAGLQLLLESTNELATPTATVSGNALIVDISNAVLSLSESDELLESNPAAEIVLIQVAELSGDRVQVVITGTNAPPTVEVTPSSTGLVLSVVPGIAQVGEAEESLRIVVTGDDDDDYVAPNTTTATRTDTPLIKVPQSIQVIPEAVLDDQQVIRLNDALRNAPSVIQSNTFGGSGDNFAVRGFEGATLLRNGLQTTAAGLNGGFRETANLERVEVLRGPASILFGNIEPGGVINLVTKQPLDTQFSEITAQIGSYGLIRPTLDVTGPNESGNARYRLNAAFERSDGFRDFETNVDRRFVAPVVAFDIGNRTDLTLELEYIDDERPFDRGIPAIGDEVADVDRDTIIGEPTDFANTESIGLGYSLEHRFSDNWKLRNSFRYQAIDLNTRRTELSQALGGLDPTTGIVARAFIANDNEVETYEAQTDIQGQFSTGSINHTLLAGVDLFFADSTINTTSDFATPVNLFDPQIGLIPEPELPLNLTLNDSTSELSRVGLLLQDQIELTPQLNLLLGGRVDFFEQSSDSDAIFIPGLLDVPPQTADQSDTVFTPRVGIVYQPIEELAFYSSYSRSFQPNTLTSTTINGDFLEPEEGEQFEVGVKTNLFDGRLAATLSLFDLTKTNVAAPDPTNGNFVVAIGEQSSRGIELDVTGEILPGWNILGGVSFLDAEIEESSSFADGATPRNVPDTSASLWSTYEIQSGNLAGLGFGLGVYYVDERPGDDANTFTLDDYLRTDAAVYYRRDNFRVGLNVRNLFDVTYFESSIDRRGALPGEPVTIIGSLAITF